MNKPLAIAMLSVAGFCYAVIESQPDPIGPQRSEPVPAEIPSDQSELPPVETPLVERVLPLPPQRLEKPSETSKTAKMVTTPRDGQLSPRGAWRWSTAQWAWVPVKQPGPSWHQNGHSATVDHLVNTHGIDRETAERMTPSQRDIAHSNAHNAARSAPVVRSSGCPGGNCPAPSRGGFFRRR